MAAVQTMSGVRRMRSTGVAIPALTFLAAGLLTACNPGREKRACVDPGGRAIQEIECRRPGGAGRYYYYRGSSYRPGQQTSGGSFTKGGSGAAHSASKVGRGGFGGKSSGG